MINQDDTRDKERAEQEANKAASENMADNDEQQNAIFRIKQNQATQSTDSTNDADALSNNHEHGLSNDALSIEEKNKRKLESEQDADFGNEQLQ